VPYLTGDGVDGVCDLSISFANEPFLRRAIMGQITELLRPENWEAFGSLSVDDTLALVHDALSTLSLICLPEELSMFVWARRNTTFNMSPHVTTKITGLTADFDTGQWDNGNQRVNIDADGLYVMQPMFSTPVVSRACIAIFYVNGAAAMTSHQSPDANYQALATQPMLFPLSAGDTVELYCRIFNDASIITVNGWIGYMLFRLGSIT